jgi:predicted translin family RNA/ssDNA-binding protein
LLGKLFSLIELLGIFIGNALLKSELDKAEQSYKEFKDKSRTVLSASKETSIALKSKDLDDIQVAFQNWNNAINKIDNNLKAYFDAVTEHYVDR